MLTGAHGARARQVIVVDAARFGHDAGAGSALGARGGVRLVPVTETSAVARRRLRAREGARKRVREASNVHAVRSGSGHVAIIEFDRRPVALQVIDNYPGLPTLVLMVRCGRDNRGALPDTSTCARAGGALGLWGDVHLVPPATAILRPTYFATAVNNRRL